MIFARKIYKIPEFYMIFARKMPEFYIIIARKIFSRILGGGARAPPCPRLLRLCMTMTSVRFTVEYKTIQFLFAAESLSYVKHKASFIVSKMCSNCSCSKSVNSESIILTDPSYRIKIKYLDVNQINDKHILHARITTAIKPATCKLGT